MIKTKRIIGINKKFRWEKGWTPYLKPCKPKIKLTLITTLFLISIGFSKFNVLFLIADDMNKTVGTYGHPQIKTPHLDKLADRGIRFDRAFNNETVCNTSRTSFSVGVYPPHSGGNVTTYVNNNPGRYTLPRFFRENGYYTARVGKFFHQGVPGGMGTDGPDDLTAWVDRSNPEGIDRTVEPQLKLASSGCSHLGSCMSWLAVDSEDEEHSDGIVATEVIEILKTQSTNPDPFFVVAGFYRPHVPYIAPTKYFDMYPVNTVEIAPKIANDRDDIPDAAEIHAEYFTLTDQLQREARQGYYASVSLMDASVGRILTSLDSLGLTDSTIVLFTSDHGYNLGEHGLWEKPTLFEDGIQVPLIISAPGIGPVGEGAQGIVELVDLYPTLADLCKLTAPDHLTGTTLRPLLQNPKGEGKLAGFSRKGLWGSGYSIRTADGWHYNEWSNQGGGAELYNLNDDPLEYNNLINDNSHQALIDSLDAWLEVMKQPGYKSSPLTLLPVVSRNQFGVSKNLLEYIKNNFPKESWTLFDIHGKKVFKNADLEYLRDFQSNNKGMYFMRSELNENKSFKWVLL